MTFLLRRILVAPAALLALALAACGGGGGGDGNGNGDGGGDGGGGDDGGGGGGGGGGSGGETYAVGGTVTGLTGSGLVIRNGADSLTIDAPGAFVFAQEIDDGATYAVEVETQPVNPENVCTVDNGSGNVDGADVVDIEITCGGPLALVSTAPADKDPAVSRAVEPFLTFSKDVDAASVAADSVTLASDAGEVELNFDVSGPTVTLSPEGSLLPLTDYTLTVTQGVEGTDGERLPAPVTTNFRTRDAAWLADLEIDSGSADVAEAQIAFDGEGNALAVWSQATLDSTDLWWNYYRAGAGWGTAVPLELNGDDLYAGGVQLGFDAAGHALAVWILTDSVTNTTSVRASRFLASTGWEKPDYIESEAGTVWGYADMAINADGDAVAVWSQFDATTMNIWFARYAAGGGWETPEIIDESDDDAESPRVAINGGGEILVVWPMRDVNNFAWDVWARQFTAGDWRDSKPLSEGNDFEAVAARPVMDEDGNALVVWAQGLGLQSGLYARRYSAAGGWDAPEQLSVSDSIHGPSIAIAPDGNAIAVWEQHADVNGVPEMLAYSSRHVAGAGWDTPQPISNATASYPKVAIDASGNALAAWFQVDLTLPFLESFSVWANRYVDGSGWTAAEQVGSHGYIISIGMPNLAIDPNGDAFAIWTRDTEVRVNRFE